MNEAQEPSRPPSRYRPPFRYRWYVRLLYNGTWIMGLSMLTILGIHFINWMRRDQSELSILIVYLFGLWLWWLFWRGVWHLIHRPKIPENRPPIDGDRIFEEMREAAVTAGASIVVLAIIGFILLCIAALLEKTMGVDSQWLDQVVELSGV